MMSYDTLDYDTIYRGAEDFQDHGNAPNDKVVLLAELYRLVELDAINEVKFNGFPNRYMSHDIELFNYRYKMCCIAEYMDNPTVCRMSIMPNLKNIYGMPTRCLVMYPDLSTAEMEIYNEATPDGVVPFYDTMIPGYGRITRVMPWIRRYCDAQLTYDTQIATHRTPLIMAGTTREELQDQVKVITELASGVKALAMPLNVVSEISVLDLKAPWDVPDLIQSQAEIMRRIYACLGLDAPSWQKKERLIVDEQEANDESLSRVLQDMLESRRLSCEVANEKYGWNVTVDLTNKPRLENGNNETGRTEPYLG